MIQRAIKVAVLLLLLTSLIGATGYKRGLTGPASLPEKEIVVDDRPAVQGEGSPVYPVKRASLSSVAAPLAPGTYTIGAAGTFPTLSAAVAALNLDGVTGTGTVALEFIDPSYSDTGCTLGPIPGQGVGTPIVFRPAAGVVANIKIVGGTSGNTFNFRINNANSVTLDGSNSGGTDRSLTLWCDTLGSVPANRNGLVIQRGSQNITVKNMIIRASRRTASPGGSDVIRVVNSTFAAFGAQQNVTIDNCWILGGGSGITTAAASAATRDQNFTFTNNLLGGAGSPNYWDNLNFAALTIDGTNNLLFQNNHANGIMTNSGTSVRALSFVGGYTNVLIKNNKFHNIEYSAGTGRIINVLIGNNSATSYSGIGPATATFEQNAFYGFRNFGTNGTAGDGVIYNPTGPPNTSSGEGSRLTWTYNTWNMDFTGSAKTVYGYRGNFMGSLQPGISDSAFLINNVIYTKSTGNNYAMSFYEPNDTGAGELGVISDHNVLYSLSEEISGTWGFAPFPWPDGDGLGPYTFTFADWQGVTGNDVSGSDGEMAFLPDDYLVNQNLGFLSAADSLGVPIPGTTIDLQGEPRDANFPDAGADEFHNIAVSNDGGAIAVLLPNTLGVPANIPNTVSVKVKNYGVYPINIPAHVTITDPSATEIYNVVETVPAVPPNTTVTYTFTAPVPVGGVGAYTVAFMTEVPGDERTFNDGPIYHIFVAQPSRPGIAYSTDWESGADDWTGTMDFQLGTFTKLSGPHSGNYAWVTNLTGNYTNAVHSQLISPWFDFRANPVPRVDFWSNFFTEPEWDAAIMEYTEDGSTWIQLGTYHDSLAENWYNSPGFPDCYDVANANWIPPTFPVGPKWTTLGGDCPVPDTTTPVPTGWTHHQILVPQVGGKSAVRFRYRTMQDASTASDGWVVDDFAVNVAASARGRVFVDVNGNGVDDGEPGLAGIAVSFVGTMNTSVTTENDGSFIAYLLNGQYVVSTSGSGTQTIPDSGYSITVTGGTTDGLNFGYYHPASISGVVYFDQNHNAARDPGETGVENVQVRLSGPVPDSMLTDPAGRFSFVVEVPGTYTGAIEVPPGYVAEPSSATFSHTVTFGDVFSSDEIRLSAASLLLQFRTATMMQWADARNLKGKYELEKCKPDKVEFEFLAIAPSSGPSSGLTVDLGMNSSGRILRGMEGAPETVAVWNEGKRYTFTGNITAGETLLVRGWGAKGKTVKARLTWGTLPRSTKTPVALYRLNQPRLPAPNFVNLLSELGSWPTIGNTAGAGSVLHLSYKDVQKSFQKKGVFHTGVPSCLRTYGGKPLKKQIKSFDPVKGNNTLFAEVLALGLNLRASATGHFPSGLGGLRYVDPDSPSHPLNGLTIGEIYSLANEFLGCGSVTADSVTTALRYYDVLHRINGAFAPEQPAGENTLDTLSWSCGGVVAAGVRSLSEIPYLQADPGFSQPMIQPSLPGEVPAVLALHQNYPNPFNPTTVIGYSLPVRGAVTLKVFNLLGQEVATLIDNELKDEGEDEVEFDALMHASGVYIYRLTVKPIDSDGSMLGQSFTLVRKMLLLK